VALAAGSGSSLRAAEEECRRAGAVATLVLPLDVSDRAAVEAALDRTAERFGRVDAVVDTAAVVAYGRFDELPPELFDEVLTTNLLGAANVARAALDRFRRQRGEGSLVIVGSLLGKIVAPYMSSYVTSKWALHGLVRTLQIEARQTPGIGVTLVSPGGVDTPIYQQAANHYGREGRPPPPVDPPEKVARAIVRAVRRPRREVSVGVANPVIVLGFRAVPAIFDALVEPLMRAGGLSRRTVPPNSGNVLAPRPEGNAVHGAWGRHWLRPVGFAVAAAGVALTPMTGTVRTLNRVLRDRYAR